MSRKKAKKQRMSALFDPDNVKSKLAEQDMVLADIREHLRAVKETDMKQLMNSTSPLSENEALQVLVCKLTVKRLDNLKIAIQNVPDNIPPVIDGIQLRLTYIYKIFNALSETNCDTGLSVEDVRDYVALIETYCPSFLSKQDCQNKLDKLWELTATESMPFNRFLTPPLKMCLRCERSLTMKNYPAKVKVFTTDGPLPCSKITLECRSCPCVYGVCNFSDKLKMHFYPEEMQIDLVEVSNVTYMDLELYKWFPALR